MKAHHDGSCGTPMTVSPALSATLTAIGEVMSAAGDPWWIIAGAAAALHGADAGDVGDVDVLLSTADARRLLPAIAVAPRRGAAHPAFRSALFARWTDAAPLPVEFMASFCHRSEEAWVPVRPATRQRVRIGEAALFVPVRTELIAMLTAFGRPKDLARARRLAALHQAG